MKQLEDIVRKYWTRVNQSSGQTQNRVAPCPVSGSLFISIVLRWFQLGCLQRSLSLTGSTPCVQCSLANFSWLWSPTSWSLHHNPDFIITAIYDGLLQAPYKDRDPPPPPTWIVWPLGLSLLLHLSCPKDRTHTPSSTLVQLSWAEAIAFQKQAALWDCSSTSWSLAR